MIMQTMIDLPPNFDMVTIKRASVPNLKSFGPTKTELRTKEVGELSFLCYMGKWAGGVILPTNMAACAIYIMEIFKTLNSRKFCIYWCIDLKVKRAETFKNGVIYILLKFCPKNR